MSSGRACPAALPLPGFRPTGPLTWPIHLSRAEGSQMFHLPAPGWREKGEGRVPSGAEIPGFAPMVSEMG